MTAQSADPATATHSFGPGVYGSGSPAGRVGVIGRRILLANVVAEVGIVVTGGLVRLTGSGLGCPTWPECTENSLVPVAAQSEGFHKFIEFGNRLLTFAVLAVAISALIVVLRPWLARRITRLKVLGQPGAARRPLVWMAVGVNIGIVVQALLGGVTVWLDLHPAIVAAHFLVSMVMIAISYVLYRRSGDNADQPVTIVVRPELRWLAYAILALSVAVLALGTLVTGSGPHSGDTDVTSRFDLDVRVISWLHADVVLVFLGLVLAFALGARLTHAPRNVSRASVALITASLLQGAIGYAQYLTGVPVPLVSLHMLGACLVWIATLEVLVSTRTRGRGAADSPEGRSVVIP